MACKMVKGCYRQKPGIFLSGLSKEGFQNWSKALSCSLSEPIKLLAAQSTAYALLNQQGE